MYTSLADGLTKIAAKDGWGQKGLTLGWGPTFVGYSA